MKERRRYPRHHYELRGYNLYRDGDWIPVPQGVVRAVLLRRLRRRMWVPSFPASQSAPIGDDVAQEILKAKRLFSNRRDRRKRSKGRMRSKS